MYYTSIAYKSNNKVYIGHTKSGLKDIESFKPLFGVNNIFNENILYIVMVSQIDSVVTLYELDKIFFISICDTRIADLPEDELITICNKVLSGYLKSMIFH